MKLIRNRFKRLTIILLFIVFMVTSAGCTDSVDIDKRDMVSTIGIDVGKDILKVKEMKSFKEGDPFLEEALETLRVTYGYPNINELDSTKGTEATERFISTDAHSMQDAFNKNILKTSREVTTGIERVILISEDIFKYKDIVKEVFDYLSRDNLINKSAYVVVCQGRPEDYIKFQPSNTSNLENFLEGLMEDSQRYAMVFPTRLNEVVKEISSEGVTIIPRFHFNFEENQLEISSNVVIKDCEIVNELTLAESANLNLIRGKEATLDKVVYKGGNPIDFTIKSSNSKIKADVSDKNNPVFNIELSIKGDVSCYNIANKLFDSQEIKKLEDNFSEVIAKECARTIKFKQQEAGVDLIGFKKNLEAMHNLYFNDIKNNWDDIYKNAEVNISVKTHIVKIGLTK